MEDIKMEESSNENAEMNAKISDSGYSNTCSNSQSQRSSGSSISRNSNESESSGYQGGTPFISTSSNSTLPRPITKQKKKKTKLSGQIKTFNSDLSTDSSIANLAQDNILLKSNKALLASLTENAASDKKTDEAAIVELVDATDPGTHNDELASKNAAAFGFQTNPFNESNSLLTEELFSAISMHNGCILYATPALEALLEYPNDFLIGKIFLDCLLAKDRCVFTDSMASIIDASRNKLPNDCRQPVVCRLQKHKSAKAKDEAHYVPMRVKLHVKNFIYKKPEEEEEERLPLLIASFENILPAFKASEETIMAPVFRTRQTSTCQLSHVDNDVVQYLGYLPQDMIGRSLFDFYHPEDLPLIKDIYETVISCEGSLFRSKPYRFIIQNGDYVIIETEWWSFVNPWTKNIEFIDAHHRVLKGPKHPNVFQASKSASESFLSDISEEVLKEAKIIQREITTLLTEKVPWKPLNIAEMELAKSKEFTDFIEQVLVEMKSPDLAKDDLTTDVRSFSEHDSVMLGEISPHHEYYDSKSSTETPPSYNQLNYNENIQRFFKSNLEVPVHYGSDEENSNVNNTQRSNENVKNNASSSPEERKMMSPVNESEDSRSAENLSSESNNEPSSGENSNSTSNMTQNQSLKPPTLTEIILHKHNEDMEKLMLQKHRKIRSSIKKDDKMRNEANSLNDIAQTDRSNYNGDNHLIGNKRSATPIREADNPKVPRLQSLNDVRNYGDELLCNQNAANTAQTFLNVSLWPQFPSHAVQPYFAVTNLPAQSMPRHPSYPPTMPIYCPPPSQQNPESAPNSNSNSQYQVHQNPFCFLPFPFMASPMPSVMYSPMVNAPFPSSVLYGHCLIPGEPPPPANQSNNNNNNNNDFNEKSKFSDYNRSASPATSAKVAPASVTVEASKSSKKVYCPREAALPETSKDSSMGSIPASKSSSKNNRSEGKGDYSSSSSFYDSFLNKSFGSSCNTETSSSTMNGYSQPKTHCKKSVNSRQRIIRKEPSWLQGVKMTPELMYEYQVNPQSLNETLKRDMGFLKKSKQPILVNEQLSQLYVDLELEGFGDKLVMDDELMQNESSDIEQQASNSNFKNSACLIGAW